MRRYRVAVLGIVIASLTALGSIISEYRHGVQLRRSCDTIVALGCHIRLHEPTDETATFDELLKSFHPYDAGVDTPWSLRRVTCEVVVDCGVLKRHADDLAPALNDLSIVRDVTIAGGPLELYDADAALNRLVDRCPSIKFGFFHP